MEKLSPNQEQDARIVLHHGREMQLSPKQELAALRYKKCALLEQEAAHRLAQARAEFEAAERAADEAGQALMDALAESE